MKNREKYPKTEDAIKAYKEYSLSRWDARQFEMWAEMEVYEPAEPEAEAKVKDDNGLEVAARIMTAVATALTDMVLEEKKSRFPGDLRAEK